MIYRRLTIRNTLINRGDPGERPNLREIVIKPEELREVKFVLPKEFVGEQT